MRRFSFAVLCSLILSASVMADTDLKNRADNAQRQEINHNQQREAEFIRQQKQLEQQRNALRTRLNQIQAQVDSLSAQFSDNESQLTDLQNKLQLESGSLGEVFGVVRQAANELQSQLQQSVTSVDKQHYNSWIGEIIKADKLPSLASLTGLWKALEEQIYASNEITRTVVPYVGPDGEKSSVEAIRLGAFALVTDTGIINWLSPQNIAADFQRLPENMPTAKDLTPLMEGDVVTVTIDPTKGELISQMAMAPSIPERIEQGGVVGYIILFLMFAGLLISLVRLVILSSVKRQIRYQLKSDTVDTGNPLSRVLAMAHGERLTGSEALELRLLEIIMDEQCRLETGLSMIKLLAALAPMLGLLGTVSGMIETFQVITQYGSGDPAIMAGGISTALITTVLGLIAAIPLLLAHNILSSQAETIRTILEKQGIGLVAERAEQAEMSPVAG